MVVQHGHVAQGGQAIVGNVNTPTPGVGATEKTKKRKNNPDALGYAAFVEIWAERSRRFGGVGKPQGFERRPQKDLAGLVVAL